MGKVFFSVSVSLDGYIAPEGMVLEDADNPAHGDWMARWGELQEWIFRQRAFRENLGIGEGGEEGADNDLLLEITARTGAHILGKRMFDGGERFWPEEAPFHTPVFVVTHTVREPWERPGGTTFYFVNDGIESALRQAREAAGGRDVRISGGANTIAQFLSAGLIDELIVSVAPVLFGDGASLWAGIDRRAVKIEQIQSIGSAGVTHLRYAVSRR